MCTLHLFNHDVKALHIAQIGDDWICNSDGCSAVFLDEHNHVFLRIHCTKLSDLVRVLKFTKAKRYVVHMRASTTDATGVSGCHMFDSPSGDWIYCHNGIIPNPERHRVDSMHIGETLNYLLPQDIPSENWSHWNFANVIAIHESGVIVVHRSYDGSLTTDGNGNWSTKRITTDYDYVDNAGWYTADKVDLKTYKPRPKPKYKYTYFNHGGIAGGAWKNSDDIYDSYDSYYNRKHQVILPTKIDREPITELILPDSDIVLPPFDDELEAIAKQDAESDIADEFFHCACCDTYCEIDQCAIWDGHRVCLDCKKWIDSGCNANTAIAERLIKDNQS